MSVSFLAACEQRATGSVLDVDDGKPARSGDIVAEAVVLNLVPPSKIGTGICFLDHMVDQLTSHGQLGVTLRCGLLSGQTPPGSGDSGASLNPKDCFAPLRDYASGSSSRPHDQDIFIACGKALGRALKKVVDEVAAAAAAVTESSSSSGMSGVPRAAAVFCCPLDEAFAEAEVDLLPARESRGRCVTSLEPYGKFAGSPAGRRWIGRYRTELTPFFWSALASGLGCDLSLRKVRGGNAHHQLESTFKAFARAFRAALDHLADGGCHGCAPPHAEPVAPAAPPAEPRCAQRQRATKETTIEVRIDLDAPWLEADEPPGGASAWSGKPMTASKLRASVQSTSRIASGIAVLDSVLEAFAKAAGIQMIVRCEGDRHIDDHHTAEDVAITLGQCLHEALGDKAGLARMGCAEGAAGGARVRTVLDLSNRPHFESDLPLDEEYVGGAPAGGGGDEGGQPAPWDSLYAAAVHALHAAAAASAARSGTAAGFCWFPALTTIARSS